MRGSMEQRCGIVSVWNDYIILSIWYTRSVFLGTNLVYCTVVLWLVSFTYMKESSCSGVESSRGEGGESILESGGGIVECRMFPLRVI